MSSGTNPVQYTLRQGKYPASAMAWGGISYWGKSPLVWLDDHLAYGQKRANLDAEGYCDLLEEVKPSLDRQSDRLYWFQQDGAPIHTASLSRQWCRENFPHFIPQDHWP